LVLLPAKETFGLGLNESLESKKEKKKKKKVNIEENEIKE